MSWLNYNHSNTLYHFASTNAALLQLSRVDPGLPAQVHDSQQQCMTRHFATEVAIHSAQACESRLVLLMNDHDVPEDQQPPDNQTLPDLDVAKRVYLLSALLQKQQRKLRTVDVLEESLNVVRNTGLAPSAKVLNHIVILLSRGTVDEVDLLIAASAGPLRTVGSTAFITYHRPCHILTTRPSSPPSSRGITQNTKPPPPQSPQRGDMGIVSTTTHKPTPIPSSSVFVLDPVRSNLHIEEILAKAPADVNFPEYTESALKVTRATAQKLISLDQARHFFMHHCHPKIRKRLNYIVKMYFDTTKLVEWSPETLEQVDEEVVDSLHPSLEPILATVGISRDGDGYPFNRSNASQWLDSVVLSVRIFRKRMAAKPDDDSSLSAQSNASCVLHHLLKAVPSSLWKIKSLAKLLSDLRSAYLTRSHSPLFPGTDEPNELEEDEPSDTSFLDNSSIVPSLNSIPPGSSLFICSLDATTAWTTATWFLSKHRFLKSHIPIRCSLVDLPNEKPTHIGLRQCKSLTKRWFDDSSESVSQDQEKVLNAIISKGNNVDFGFRGACHCEIGIMASMVASIGEDESLKPMTDEIKAAFLPFANEYYQEAPGGKDRFMDIGVAKKSCAICYLTADVVNHWLKKRGHQLQFRLPGAHSVYFTWMPPTWLPIEVLNDPEAVMLARLKSMLVDHDGAGQSSPNDTDDEGVDSFQPEQSDFMGQVYLELDSEFSMVSSKKDK